MCTLKSFGVDGWVLRSLLDLSSWVTTWNRWNCCISSPLCLFGWFFARLKMRQFVGKDVAFLDANTCQLNDIQCDY